MGRPDNDFLIYLPVYDMWNEQPGRLLLFTIHHMDKLAPKFIDAIHRINNSGYDGDYISDNFIRSTRFKDGQLVTSGGTGYKALVVPAAHLMPSDVLAHLYELAKQGATIVFLENYPTDVPGYGQWNKNAKVPAYAPATSGCFFLGNNRYFNRKGEDYHRNGLCTYIGQLQYLSRRNENQIRTTSDPKSE